MKNKTIARILAVVMSAFSVCQPLSVSVFAADPLPAEENPAPSNETSSPIAADFEITKSAEGFNVVTSSGEPLQLYDNAINETILAIKEEAGENNPTINFKDVNIGDERVEIDFGCTITGAVSGNGTDGVILFSGGNVNSYADVTSTGSGCAIMLNGADGLNIAGGKVSSTATSTIVSNGTGKINVSGGTMNCALTLLGDTMLENSPLIDGIISNKDIDIIAYGGKLTAGNISNSQAYTVGVMSNNGLADGTIIVKNCTDASKFTLVNKGFTLAVKDGNLVAVPIKINIPTDTNNNNSNNTNNTNNTQSVNPTVPNSYSFIKINKTKSDVVIGKTLALTAKSSAGKKISWSVSNEKIAKITADGVLTALSHGVVTVTATDEMGQKTTLKIVCHAKNELFITQKNGKYYINGNGCYSSAQKLAKAIRNSKIINPYIYFNKVKIEKSIIVDFDCTLGGIIVSDNADVIKITDGSKVVNNVKIVKPNKKAV